MSLTVSWQVGAGTPVSVTFGITNTRAKAMIERYARRHGLIAEGATDAQVVEAVIRSTMHDLAAESARAQRAEAIAAQEATLDATVTLDNELG